MRWKYWGRELADLILWYYPGLGSTFPRLVTSPLIRCCLTTEHFNQSLEMCSPWPIPYTNSFCQCDLYIWIFSHLQFFLHTTRAKHKLILANFSYLRREERRRDLTCNQMQSAQPDANYLLVINPGIIETTSSQTRPLENFPPISPNLGIFIRV